MKCGLSSKSPSGFTLTSSKVRVPKRWCFGLNYLFCSRKLGWLLFWVLPTKYPVASHLLNVEPRLLTDVRCLAATFLELYSWFGLSFYPGDWTQGKQLPASGVTSEPKQTSSRLILKKDLVEHVIRSDLVNPNNPQFPMLYLVCVRVWTLQTLRSRVTGWFLLFFSCFCLSVHGRDHLIPTVIELIFMIQWYKSVPSGRIFSQQRIYLFGFLLCAPFQTVRIWNNSPNKGFVSHHSCNHHLNVFKMEALFSVLCPVALLNFVYICSYLGSLCWNHCNDVTFSFDRAVIKVLVYQEQTPLNTENDS